MLVNVDSGLGGLPSDRALADRLRASFELLPRAELLERFLKLLAIASGNPLPPTAARLGIELDHAVVAMVAGLDAPIEARHRLCRLGVELRRNGYGPADAHRLAGTLMAALVDVAGHRWPMATIIEWGQAVTLLFESALTGRGADRGCASSDAGRGEGATTSRPGPAQ